MEIKWYKLCFVRDRTSSRIGHENDKLTYLEPLLQIDSGLIDHREVAKKVMRQPIQKI